ncbi:hypothetical protein JTB14_033315 [Gonioctena quinquepunctata]|nr:hypothetical protein JTB14_033315 [Gonioctena quinquepunctata]
MFWKLCILSFVFQCGFCDQLRIAGIFEVAPLHREAFTASDNFRDIQRQPSKVTLSSLTKVNILPEDAFSARKDLCYYLENGIVGIFGPQTNSNLDIIQSIADKRRIPHILTRWFHPSQMTENTINFYPSTDRLADAYLDIIMKMEWESFTILYTSFENLRQITEFIGKAKDEGLIVYMEDTDPSGDGNYRPILQEVFKSGQRNFVLDCPFQNLEELLAQIQQVGMLTTDFNFFVTNLDAHTVDLTTFMYSDATITGVHMVKPDEELLISVNQELCRVYSGSSTQNCDSESLQDYSELESEIALVIDAVHVFSEALQNVGVNESRVMKCSDSSDFWEKGLQVIDALKSGTYEGLTGTIEFGENGFRKTFNLTVFQLMKGSLVERGSWNTTSGIDMEIDIRALDVEDGEESMRDKNFVVLITLTKPYAMLRESPERLIGNEKYEGFAIDLIDEIAMIEGFEYILKVREDNKHGHFDIVSGKWTGMIGDIIEMGADLAISDLTITQDRVDPVEFTQPFMSTGISILYHKPNERPPDFLYFAQPFSATVWQALVLSYIATSLTLFIIGRLSFSEWHQRDTCGKNKYLVNHLTFLSSFWYTSSYLFKQNANVKISSLSAKIVCACWWILGFFTLAMYIAFSTSRSPMAEKEIVFENVFELVERAEDYGIKFGALKGGATETFFKSSNAEIYKEIGIYMEEHPEEMVSSTEDGIERAETENYAFFMESATIEYAVRRHCNLSSYGGLLDNKGFGIAVRKGSPILIPLNKAILKLHTSGDILRIKRKWWEEKNGGEVCDDDLEIEAAPKELAHVYGLLWITLFGTILALLCSIVEFGTYVHGLSKKLKHTFGRTFFQELRNVFRHTKIQRGVEPILYVKSENERNATPESVEMS